MYNPNEEIQIIGANFDDIQNPLKKSSAIENLTKLNEKLTLKSRYDNAIKEIERLNNIINCYANMKKELLDYIYHNEYSRFGHIDGGEAEEMREIISKTDKLKALKEDDDNE